MKGADETGNLYGRLLVLGRHPVPARDRRFRWICRCSCGAEVVVPVTRLRSGTTRSCGCLRLDQQTTHGCSKRGPWRLQYRAWQQMIARCHRPTSYDYKYYGARGIYVCRQWRESFQQFLFDMGPRPDGLTIDRIDNDGPYEPDNCRWATVTEQNRHQRSTRLTPEVARQVRALASSGIGSRRISRRLGVGRTTIRKVIAGISWTAPR